MQDVFKRVNAMSTAPLSVAPLVQRRQNRRANVHFKALSFFFHGDSSIFERQE
jgi:hypothetical protein